MYITKRYFSRPFLIALLLVVSMLTWLVPSVLAGDEVKLVIDGQKVQSVPQPFIKDGRTLVPVRLVSEKLGASVSWNEETRTIQIVKGTRSVLLRVDNRLVNYQDAVAASFGLCDVPPQIFADRTFVPLRLVGDSLGVSVKWDGSSRTVYVDSGNTSDSIPSADIKILSMQDGKVITGTTTLRAMLRDDLPAAAEIKYFLLDPKTGMGTVIAKGNSIENTYLWLPDPMQNGQHLLAAAVYDDKSNFLTGCAVPIELAVQPQAVLTGITEGQTISNTASLKPCLNFLSAYIKYEIINQTSGKTTTTEELDPEGTYNWNPELADKGLNTVKLIAFDSSGQAYASAPVNFNIAIERKVELKGVSSGVLGSKPVTLWVSRNFPISQIEYLLKNMQTGQEEVLAQSMSYKWFPGPERAGNWELKARVKDTIGNTYITDSVSLQITGVPVLLLDTVGPNQVLTGTVNLKASSNIPLQDIKYHLIKPETGAVRVIAGGNPEQEYSWIPGEKDNGYWKIQAVGTPISGGKVLSEAVAVRIYLGKTYEAKPIIEKSKFLDFASELAVQSQEKTGMSAALQTAQAILETGWGQSTPVDKYTGKLSYNLFGIKGKGPAGSVISNTWEEYNGNVFRIDASFRAYKNAGESWDDHKQLLLTASRYEQFRTVMNNSTQGAWALKRAGYATDSKYPIKLIDIIKRYNLHLLDVVGV